MFGDVSAAERIKADRCAAGEEFTYRLMKAFSAAGAP